MDYKKYPDAEARKPREVFTKKLVSICKKLDLSHTASFECRDYFFKSKIHQCQVTAKSLWVVGSYARGASHCGDLDLLLDIGDHSRKAPAYVSLRHLLGSMPDVRAMAGTPDNKGGDFEYSEAVLVWEPGMDWRAAINSIALDDSAGRFARDYDAIPMRREQTDMSFEWVDDYLERLGAGILKWSFVPLSQINPVFEPESANESYAFRFLGEKSEMKKKLMPLACGFARNWLGVDCLSAPIERGWDAPSFSTGGLCVQLEQLWPRYGLLDEINVSAMAYLPALSTRGPNGAWVIERGPNHPVVKMFERLKAWVLYHESGAPVSIVRGVPLNEFSVSKVFGSEQEALDASVKMNKPSKRKPSVTPCIPRLLEGADLLSYLGGFDVCESADGGSLALGPTGRWAAGGSARYGEWLDATEVRNFFNALKIDATENNSQEPMRQELVLECLEQGVAEHA